VFAQVYQTLFNVKGGKYVPTYALFFDTLLIKVYAEKSLWTTIITPLVLEKGNFITGETESR